MASIISHRRTIPPEIWSQILQNVPEIQLPNLLIVCSQFHDIIIRIIFASVKIYFFGGERAMNILNTIDVDWAIEVSTKLVRKSWGILNRICQDPQFARVIKSITVIAFADGLGMLERLTVANLFSFVPNLQTFRWIGKQPSFDENVAKSLPKTLKHLVLQSPIFPLESLRHISQLTTLHLSIPFFFPDDEEAYDRLVEDIYVANTENLPVEDILNVFSTNLQSLRLCAMHIRSVPIRAYYTLRELEIFGTISDEEELSGLDVVFRHSTTLESLSLVGYIDYAFASFLPHYSATNSLPHLTSFRLSVDNQGYLHDDDLSSICGFLEGRLSLRRLYIRLPELKLAQAKRLLSVIRELRGLEVLGFHTGMDYIHSETLSTIVDSLSPNLHALHLALNWGDGSLLQLVDGISKLPHLSFIHLYGIQSRLPILIGDLAEEAPGLNTIGLNRGLWSIDRVGLRILTTKWPRWRTKLCIEEDFVYADDAWLFKYN